MTTRRRSTAALLSALAIATGTAGLVATARAADVVKIGFLTTLSGPGAVVGTDVRDGFALGLKHAGDKLGGLPVEMSVVDDQQNPDTGRQAVERFLKQGKVDLVTGTVFSNVLLPVLPTILAADTVMLSPNSGPQDYAGAKCNANFFAVAWQNEDIPAAMGQFATDRKYAKVALIGANYPGGRESLGGFKRLYKGAVTDEIYTKLNQLDFSAELATIKAGKPDAVFFFLPGGLGVNFIKQFSGAGMGRDMALLAPGFSADEDTIRAVGDAIAGAFNAAQWSPDLPNPANQKFVADFTKAYGRAPTLYASQGYDTAMLIDGAVKKVGGKIEDKTAFRAALAQADFQSVRGSFRFNTNHYPIHDIYMREVVKNAAGQLTNKTVGKVLTAHADPFVGECAMK